ncbi:MAG: DUF2855 family protein [Polaromonas sp.]
MTPTATQHEFLVNKTALQQHRWRSADTLALAPGQVRLEIASFALTANNITYAAFGDAMNYWQFFPTGEDGWGCIPVWGFATVSESLCDDVAVGERFYGYYPMANTVVMQPVRASAQGFSDGAAHRASLHPVYNNYLRCNGDPLYTADTEDLQALLRPLFITSFLIDDFLADNDWFGACAGGQRGVMLLSSASSKTAYGTAFQMAQRPGIEVVGLTSPANVAFCESLGCYSRVLTYDQLEELDADTPCVYVDFAGNGGLRQRIHSRLAQLKYSCSIGGTHVDELGAKGSARDLPGVRPALFFAPAQIKKRYADWGPEEFGKQLVQAWHGFLQRVTGSPSPWLVVKHDQGRQAVESIYLEVLGGQGDARTGHVLSP